MESEQSGHLIPVPSGEREVMKVNVLEHLISSNVQLVPVFPYFGPGAMVVCSSMVNGGADGLSGGAGRFWHENTQDEVGVAYGTSNPHFPTGQLLSGSRIHGVQGFFTDDDSPDDFVVVTITQRQKETVDSDTQHEAMSFRCEECHNLLYRFEYDADGRPGHDSGPSLDGAMEGRFEAFPTILGASLAAKRVNASAELRTCSKCEHLNPAFPIEEWGWGDWVAQRHAANLAYRSLIDAGKATTAGAA